MSLAEWRPGLPGSGRVCDLRLDGRVFTMVRVTRRGRARLHDEAAIGWVRLHFGGKVEWRPIPIPRCVE